MSFLKKLFGGGGSGGGTSEPTAEAEDYKGCRITPTPIAEGSTYRVCAMIEKDVDGETKQHKLVRADTLQDRDEAEAACIRKAKQVIDEQGDRLFE
ncbi:HlyU family transcriptional regulator [uncultured Roseobacter sp.]|uniref:HlyU family transcriptional regulator n=1 Tax=uncultured Roseobacter sp. TaxID=114847 RepID=UPI002610A169|nr:HlyU family transcriptional regulator [uncultured Roseobacter sp.]